jgi:hypothetical protein
LHKFHKERRRSPKDCFKCDDTTHFIDDCLKRKKLDSPTIMPTPTRPTIARAIRRRRTTSETTRRRSYRRSCPERVLP